MVYADDIMFWTNNAKEFGHKMRVTEERIPKKMLHTKMKGKQPRERPRSRWIDQIRKDIEIRRGKWEEIKENS
jgi:hypothetical protein